MELTKHILFLHGLIINYCIPSNIVLTNDSVLYMYEYGNASDKYIEYFNNDDIVVVVCDNHGKTQCLDFSTDEFYKIIELIKPQNNSGEQSLT